MTLPPNQRAAIEALTVGKNQTEAAAIAGVQARTVRRWLADPTFVAELHAAQDRALGDVVRRMREGMASALDVIEGLMASDEVKAGVRLRAALGLIDRAFRGAELVELTERVAELEARFSDDTR